MPNVARQFLVTTAFAFLLGWSGLTLLAQVNNKCAVDRCTRNGASRVSAADVAQYAHDAGFRCADLVMIVAVAGAESGFAPKCETDNTGSIDYGLWQFNNNPNIYPIDPINFPRWPNCAFSVSSATNPAQAATTALCLVQHATGSNRGFNWSNAYKNRFTSTCWNDFLTTATLASAQFLADDKCSNQSSFVGQVVGPQDPNDKAGSQGAGTGQYIAGQTPLRYAVFFSNEPNATAPAQKVVVSDQLNLATDDLATFSLGPIALPNQLVIPPSGLSDFSTIADLRPGNNILVAVTGHLDKSTGLLTWTFQSLDPATNQPPLDPLAGFLPAGAGGSTFFTVMPKITVSTDTQVQNHASIVFDTNPSISTPTWLNTIDIDAPQSHVFTLPAQSPASVPLQWTGTDVGAGVQDFTIFVSDNGDPFTPFLSNTTSASAIFPGQPGHTYGFFSTARDLVGNTEELKTTAEATTTVVTDAIPPTTIAVVAPPANTNGWNNSNVSITLSSTDNPGGSGVQQITFSATGGQPIPSTNVAGNSAIAMISTEKITNLNFFATDLAKNVEAAHTLTVKLDKTAPTITGVRTPLANANGWNNTNVTASFACSDALSGLAAGSPPAATVLSSEGTNQQVSGTCFDLAGNSASAAVSGINIDKTSPALSGLPVANCTLWPPDKKFITVAATSAADVLSGLASFNVTGMSNEPQNPNDPDIIITGMCLGPRTVQLRADRLGTGTGRVYTLTSTATDAAGNVVNAISTCLVPHDQAL